MEKRQEVMRRFTLAEAVDLFRQLSAANDEREHGQPARELQPGFAREGSAGAAMSSAA
jgi:hypothetical protein